MGSDDDLRLDTVNSLAQLLSQSIKFDAGATSSAPLPHIKALFSGWGLKNSWKVGTKMLDAPNRIFPNKLPISLTVSSPSPAL